MCFYFKYVTQYTWARCSASFSFSEDRPVEALPSWSSVTLTWNQYLPRRYLAMPSYITHCHNCREWYWKLMARDTVKHPIIHRTDPVTHTITWFLMSTVSSTAQEKTDGSSVLHPDNTTSLLSTSQSPSVVACPLPECEEEWDMWWSRWHVISTAGTAIV